MNRLHLAIYLLVAGLFLSACQRTESPRLQSGPVSGTGTLIPADISLLRRGSHMLVLASGKKYYVESKTENLQELEGLTVYIEGHLEHNTKKSDAPVIVVDTIRGALNDIDVHVWNVPSLNLRIKAPNTWKPTIEKNTVSFSLNEEIDPILTIRIMSGTSLPPGSTFFVQNRRAVKSDTEGTVIREMYILENNKVIRLHFDPSQQKHVQSLVEAKILESQFDRLLSDLTFLSDSAFNHTQTGSGSIQTCGGEAKILCTGMQFCDITDSSLGTGICKNKPK